MEGLSIVIPVYNEEKSLLQLFQELKQTLPKLNLPYEIIFVNDCSQDKSKEILNKEKDIAFNIITHKRRKGYGASIKDGIKLASYDYVCFLDSDCAHSPSLILEALKKINSYDILIGIRNESSKIFTLSQKIARFFIAGLFSLLFRKKVKDINSGFRITRKNIIEKYLPLLPDTFSFSSSLTLIILLEKISFINFPIEIRKRKGYSKVRRTSYSFQFLKCLSSTYIKWLKKKILK